MIGASLSTLTMFPVTPMTCASKIEFGILAQSLRDKRFEDGPPALSLQLLPVADDVPAGDVEHHGFEAEIVVFSTFLQVGPGFPQHAPVEGDYISLLEQVRKRQDPGKNMAQPEIRLVEVATDVREPRIDTDRGRAQAVAATTQCRHDRAYIHIGGEHLTHQGVGDLLHQ